MILALRVVFNGPELVTSAIACVALGFGAALMASRAHVASGKAYSPGTGTAGPTLVGPAVTPRTDHPEPPAHNRRPR